MKVLACKMNLLTFPRYPNCSVTRKMIVKAGIHFQIVSGDKKNDFTEPRKYLLKGGKNFEEREKFDFVMSGKLFFESFVIMGHFLEAAVLFFKRLHSALDLIFFQLQNEKNFPVKGKSFMVF